MFPVGFAGQWRAELCGEQPFAGVVGTLNFGADGPAASGAEKFALTVNNAASGLTLTDGAAITLSLDGSGRIIGTVAAGATRTAARWRLRSRSIR